MAKLQRGTAYTRKFLMVLSSDSKTGATGVSPAVTLSKGVGTTFAAAGGTVTEITSGNGWYNIALTTTDTGTRGDLAYHATAATCDPSDFIDQVDDDGIYHGSVTGAATTTTLIDSGLTQGDTDWWKGRVIIFVTGTLKGEAGAITAFAFATDTLTFDAVTAVPAAADEYIIV